MIGLGSYCAALRWKAFVIAKQDFGLSIAGAGASTTLFWLWDRRNEGRNASEFSNLLGRLPGLVKFPVSAADTRTANSELADERNRTPLPPAPMHKW